jgi:glycosyltransferase involved in cell wall biosynthesis
MRILIATFSSRQVGGAERYLGRIMPLLSTAGHEVALGYEMDAPTNRSHLLLPDDAVSFCVTGPGGMGAAREWKPDVIYAHGLLDPDVEEQILQIAPAVFFGHTYYGSCISGAKTHKFPVVQPCDRRFGAACLALFFPRRCGGLNPLTMARDYALQRRRLALLGRYAAVVTHSAHMQREFARHGAANGRVFTIPYTVTGGDRASDVPPLHVSRSRTGPWQLLFIGRMDRLKGGEHLMDALSRVQRKISRPLRLVFAGDGPDRAKWERRAADLMPRMPGVGIEFTGWLEPPQLTSLLDASDLVVMPSLWPEPWGLVGTEANRRGVPVVAYAAGGIPEWLIEGVNGCLAPADPPTINGLAEAVIRCLGHLSSDDSLRERALAKGFATADEGHVTALLDILEQASARPRATSADAER